MNSLAHSWIAQGAVALCFLVSLSCASTPAPVSKAQCQVGDWQSLGHRDGAEGQRSSDLLELQETCLTHDIQVDRETYMLGWREGVREYCGPNNGYAIGESGRNHKNVCPEDLRTAFIEAFDKGRALRNGRERVSNLDREITESTQRLEIVRKEIISTAAAQLNPLLTPSRRAQLVAELQGYNDEKNRLTAEIPRLRTERVTAERELDLLERGVSESL